VAAELESAQLEAGPRAQRRVEEHQGNGLALERVAGGMALVAGSFGQQRVDFGAAEVLGVEEVFHRGREKGEGRRGKAETKKPSAGLGFSWMQGRVRSYPAGGNSGRRAREVMPAAMRAEVRTTAVAAWRFIGRASSHGG